MPFVGLTVTGCIAAVGRDNLDAGREGKVHGNGNDMLVPLTAVQFFDIISWCNPQVDTKSVSSASFVVLPHAPPLSPTYPLSHLAITFLVNSDKYAAAKDQVVRLLTESTTNRLL